MSQKVSMKSIAKELGVSIALVSYVLNGKLTHRISPATAERIRALADKYNYTPNQIAKSLKTNKTYTLGLIVADISNIFYSELAQHIEEEAQNHGYNVIFASAYEDSEKFKSILDVFVAKQVDGLILAVPAGADIYIQSVDQAAIPYVIIDREFEGIDPIKIININNYEASASVVHHLYTAGFKRPGAIALKSDLLHLKDRKTGFIDSVAQYDYDQSFFYEIAEKELEEKIEDCILNAIKIDKVDSLFFLTSRIAMAGLAILAKYNVRVPKEVGVVCFDESHAYKIFNTPLTYVKQPLEEMSKAAVHLLINSITPEAKLNFNTQLIIKESTCL